MGPRCSLGRRRDVGRRGTAVLGGGAGSVPCPRAAAVGTAVGAAPHSYAAGSERGERRGPLAAAAEAPLVAVRPVRGGSDGGVRVGRRVLGRVRCFWGARGGIGAVQGVFRWLRGFWGA